MWGIERANLEEIAGLSQRGKTLSIVDLIEANTISLEMAAYSLYAISCGASILTAARPGNAGKTTLLACLLTFIPPKSRIITISSPSVLGLLEREGIEKGTEYMLIHEIGSGPWYAYLWGRDVSRAFRMIQPGRYLASCIHADTLDELSGILTSHELSVTQEDFGKLDLIYFMCLEGNYLTGYRRRVANMYESFGSSRRHRLLFRWDRNGDRFIKEDDSRLVEQLSSKSGRTTQHVREEIAECERFLKELCDKGLNDFRQVRMRVLDFLDAQGWEDASS
jgi:energy-coupling factor transporter ATP-binding protein EcfA2